MMPDYPDGVLDIQELPVDTKALCNAVNQAPRSPGVHLSSILKALDEMLHGKKHGENQFDLWLCAAVGFIWERVLELALGSLLGNRPEAITLDGIHMSPDGIGSDPLGRVPIVVEEYKCWWRSTKRTPMDDWYVMHQNMAYCHALGTTVGVFRVLYVVGSKWLEGPTWKEWRVEYDPAALEENWQMILRNRDLGTVEEGSE